MKVSASTRVQELDRGGKYWHLGAAVQQAIYLLCLMFGGVILDSSDQKVYLGKILSSKKLPPIAVPSMCKCVNEWMLTWCVEKHSAKSKD